MVHRDIKIENVLLAKDDKLKLIDFGLSTILHRDGPEKKVFHGTPYYFSPEMLDGQGSGKEADIWALGVLLFILLFDKKPFNGKTQNNIFQKIQACKFSIPE